MSGTGSSKRNAAVETYTELVRQVFRLNGQLIACGDEMARGEALTAARWQVLGALAGRPQTVAQLAREMEITRQSVQRTVNWLLQAGLVRSTENPNHRRAKLVALTPAGQSARTRLRPTQTAWASEVTSAFTEAELQQALAAIRKIRERLSASRFGGGADQ